jgi:tRNA-dihydrouridine synthase A
VSGADEKPQRWRFSVAPMMDWTDRHCRVFHRTMSRRARLYTEMVTVGAIIHGPRDRLLGFDSFEHPVAVQLGGSDPLDLARAARICEDFGYDEVNLNCGCPSDRVQNGAFGACLMHEPNLVGDCVAAMKAAVTVPTTVKCRLGVDDQDPEEALWRMAACVRAAGADALIVHARKAWLKGLSPRENRTTPPLDYALVDRLKQDLPDLPIATNGGVDSMERVAERLRSTDGVMVGRAAYRAPEILLRVDPEVFGVDPPAADAFAALDVYEAYVARQLAAGVRLHDMTKCLLGLFSGAPGARSWRRHLATEGQRAGAGLETLRQARAFLRAPEGARAA